MLDGRFSPGTGQKANIQQTPRSASQGVWVLVRRFSRTDPTPTTPAALWHEWPLAHKPKFPDVLPLLRQMVHVAAPRAAAGSVPHQDFDLTVGIPAGHSAVSLAIAGVVGVAEPDACGP